MRPTYRRVAPRPPGWRRIPPVTRGVLVAVAPGYLLTLVVPRRGVCSPSRRKRSFAGQVWRARDVPDRQRVDLRRPLGSPPPLELRVARSSRAGARGASRLSPLASASAACSASRRRGSCPRPSSEAASGFAPPLLALIFAWMLEGPSQVHDFFGIFPMTRLGFAAIAFVLVVFSELEAFALSLAARLRPRRPAGRVALRARPRGRRAALPAHAQPVSPPALHGRRTPGTRPRRSSEPFRMRRHSPHLFGSKGFIIAA